MHELLEKTLSQIVNEQRRTASVFEKYNLDYCCKGKRSLGDACDENHVPVNDVIADLESVYYTRSNELDFTKCKLFELAEYIVHTHHSYVKKEVPQILSYLEKVSSKHGSRHGELNKICEIFADLSNDMYRHIHSEETIVFPRIKQLEQFHFEPVAYDIKHCEYLQLPIIDLEDEHEVAGNAMAEIRKLTHNYRPPANACTTFRLLYSSLHAFEIDLHQHVHLENNILFPQALALEKQIQHNMLN